MSKEDWKIQKDRERMQRSIENRRGRKNPSVLPNKLARTSAFVPRDYNLSTDSDFERYYVVKGHSVVRVKGRELGTSHRDLIIALFRLKSERLKIPLQSNQFMIIYRVETTWREILIALDLTQHKNNLKKILELCEDFQQVILSVLNVTPDKFFNAENAEKLVGSGETGSIIRYINWEGDNLDSKVTLEYGAWVREQFEKKYLVSHNAEVQMKLKSDYAKTFWPYIDSQPNHTFVDEEMLAELAGVDLWNDEYRIRKRVAKAGEGKEDEPVLFTAAQKRAEFRANCKKAMNDIVNAGGFKKWDVENRKCINGKTRRYHYVHKLQRQLEMTLEEDENT